MNKCEFSKFIEYVQNIFPTASIPDVKEAMLAWYKPYEKISYETAKSMADRYLTEETGNFNYARLLKCKPQPRANAQAYQPAVSIFDTEY